MHTFVLIYDHTNYFNQSQNTSDISAGWLFFVGNDGKKLWTCASIYLLQKISYLKIYQNSGGIGNQKGFNIQNQQVNIIGP